MASEKGKLTHNIQSQQEGFVKMLRSAELLEAILVVFLLAQTRIVSFASRVGFVLAAGILAAITTNISYWNWYGFPATASYMLIQIVGFLLAGVAAALISPKRASH
jgi:hypothetical protein